MHKKICVKDVHFSSFKENPKAEMVRIFINGGLLMGSILVDPFKGNILKDIFMCSDFERP